MLLEEVRMVLLENCKAAPDRPLLVGVSGGPDSICMLHLLWRLGYALVVAHLDHGMRLDSKTDAQAVAHIAAEMGLPYVLGEANVPTIADQQGMSIEEAARLERYRFLFEQAAQHSAQAVAVGHTADDQVETVLMHLLRGSGLSGLRGMDYRRLPNPWSSQIPLARPLLGVWREQVLDYIETHQLPVLQDASNMDIRFHRNRLRHELIPVLEDYNPNIRQAFWRMANTLTGDYAALQKGVDSAWYACLVGQGTGYLAFSRLKFGECDLGYQRQLLRRAIAQLRPGLRDIDYAAVERALNFFAHPPRSASLDLISGLELLLEGDAVYLAAWEADLPGGDWPQLPVDETLQLDASGPTRLKAGWQFSARVRPVTPQTMDDGPPDEWIFGNDDPYQAWLDLDCLELPLEVRTRKPGDRLQPLGMAGKSLKLADFLINVKLPRRARAAWPLVCSGGVIAWVPGYRIGHSFRVRPDTTRCLHIRLERK